MRFVRVFIGALLAVALTAPAAADETIEVTPLLEAVAYVSAEAEAHERRVAFTDWAELRRVHDGAGINSDSPLAERQRLLLDIVRNEDIQTTLGLERLQSWKEAWGWENTDLEWEAHIGQDSAVLRFADHWEAEPFRAALRSRGYEETVTEGGLRFTPAAEDAVLPSRLLLRRVFMEIEPGGDTPLEAMAVVDVSDDGRTIVIRYGSRAAQSLRAGARANLDAVAATPLGRVAVALGRPLSANVMESSMDCSWDPSYEDTVSESTTELLRSVAPLLPYQASGVGYSRRDAEAPPSGRIVLAYPEATDAAQDLAGRRRIIDQGSPWADGSGTATYRDTAFTVNAIVASGRELMIEVAPVDDSPRNLFVGMRPRPLAVLLMCGPVPD